MNIYKEGKDPPLLPDDQYPEWLFEIRVGVYACVCVCDYLGKYMYWSYKGQEDLMVSSALCLLYHSVSKSPHYYTHHIHTKPPTHILHTAFDSPGIP